MADSMISVRNLTKVFGKNVIAVRDISFEVRRGEIVTLLGPSGCGKTTILRCIAGFEQPTKGEIYVSGRLVSNTEKGLLVSADNRGLGFVHQSYALWPHMSVYKHLAYALELRKLPRKEIQEKVTKTLELVRLGGYENRLPFELSGGQQQRVALSRSLVYNPPIILLDEPLSNLDAKLRDRTRFELRHLFKNLHISVLYVTHDQREALAIADRCILMKEGTIQQVGEPIEVYTNPKNAFVADFMGASNIFTGVPNQNDQDSVDLPWGTFRCEGSKPSHGKTDVKIYIWPRDVSLHKDDPRMENTFLAKVIVKTFVGDFFRLLLSPVQSQETEVFAHIYEPEKAAMVKEGVISSLENDFVSTGREDFHHGNDP
jgi:ABC-type Fe3+/spermidine/putrescine transport system ATPase subunit